MSVYLPDGEMYAGWSTGRWFGLAGVVALGVASLGFAVLHAPHTSAPGASDQLFAFYAEWVGGGLFVLMALAVLGSLKISWRERGGVEVTPEGVARIYGKRRAQFFPRAEIAGFVVRPGGGVTLVAVRGRRTMIVPRSIYGYRECIAELKAIGIQSLPRSAAPQPLTWNSMSWKERIQYFGLLSVSFDCFSLGYSVLASCIAGGIWLALFAWIVIDHRKEADRRSWAGVLGVAILILIVSGLWRLW